MRLLEDTARFHRDDGAQRAHFNAGDGSSSNFGVSLTGAIGSGETPSFLRSENDEY